MVPMGPRTTSSLKTKAATAEMSSRDLLQNPVRYGVLLGLTAVGAGFALIGVWVVIG